MFRKNKNEMFDYDIETINDVDFKLDLTYNTKAKHLKYMFLKMKNKLSKKLVLENDEMLEAWTVPDQYKKLFFPMLERGIKSNVATISGIVAKDNMIISRWNVTDALFKKSDPDNYLITIKIKGIYREL